MNKLSYIITLVLIGISLMACSFPTDFSTNQPTNQPSQSEVQKCYQKVIDSDLDESWSKMSTLERAITASKIIRICEGDQ